MRRGWCHAALPWLRGLYRPPDRGADSLSHINPDQNANVVPHEHPHRSPDNHSKLGAHCSTDPASCSTYLRTHGPDRCTDRDPDSLAHGISHQYPDDYAHRLSHQYPDDYADDQGLR